MTTIIIKREFLTLLRSKGHRIALILVAVLILCAGIVGRILLSDESETQEQMGLGVAVGVEEQMGEYAPAVQAAFSGVGSVTVELEEGSSESWIKEQVKADHEGTIYLAIGGSNKQPVIYTSDDSASAAEAGVVSSLTPILVATTVDSMVEGGLTPEQASLLQSFLSPQIVSVETENTSLFAANPIGYLLGTITCMFLFIAILSGIAVISQGVVEEKSSRVVEIILATVHPWQLLLGKILGTGAYVMIQVTIWLGCSIAAAKIAGIPLEKISQEVNIASVFIFTLLWSIVGYLIFSSLIGAVSSTVSRQEDLGAIQTPFVFAMMVPFYLAIYLVPNVPDTLYTKILSWIPGFSSFMMPMRHAFGVVSAWELWGSFALAIATIPLLAVLAGRIYKNSVLRMGVRVSFADALKRSK